MGAVNAKKRRKGKRQMLPPFCWSFGNAYIIEYIIYWTSNPSKIYRIDRKKKVANSSWSEYVFVLMIKKHSGIDNTIQAEIQVEIANDKKSTITILFLQ